MKKLIVASILAVVAASAFASCPPGSHYRCIPSYNGKMQCGCW